MSNKIIGVNREGINALKWNGDFIKRIGLINDFNSETLPMWVADMEIRIAKPIEEAIIKAANQGSFGYTTTMGNTSYYQACQNYFKRRYHFEVPTEHIFMAQGTLHTLSACIKVFTNEGDGVIIQKPVYTQFTTHIKGNNRVVVNNQLVQNNGDYSIDFENLEELAKNSKNKLMILCNPHNPIGKVYSKEDLLKIAEICERNNVVICSDEVHAGLVRKGVKHIPIASVTDYSEIVTCTDFGKTFNTASLHVCNVICQNKKHIRKLRMNGAIPMSNSFGINAVIAAYTECDEWIDNLNEHILNNKLYIKSFLNKNLPTIKYNVSDATYFAWLDFSGYGLEADEVSRIIRDECNIVLEHGGMFSEEYTHFQRMVLGCPIENVKEAMKRFKLAFSKYE